MRALTSILTFDLHKASTPGDPAPEGLLTNVSHIIDSPLTAPAITLVGTTFTTLWPPLTDMESSSSQAFIHDRQFHQMIVCYTADTIYVPSTTSCS